MIVPSVLRAVTGNTYGDSPEWTPLRVWYTDITVNDFIRALPKAVRKRVLKHIDKMAPRSSSEHDYPKLAGTAGGHIHIIDQPPLIFHPEASRAPEFQKEREQIFQVYRETLPDDRRMLLDRSSG